MLQLNCDISTILERKKKLYTYFLSYVVLVLKFNYAHANIFLVNAKLSRPNEE